MIILAVLTDKILRRVETCEKIIKIANQCLLFLPTVKHSRELHAHKIKGITIVQRAMTRGNTLSCTKPKIGIFSNIKKNTGLKQEIQSDREVKLMGCFTY